MNQQPLVSIIIDNYNYSRFLKDAIDSALNQTYAHTEVIVVDDGSTDESPAIIGEYGSKIISILKENGGQASAFNKGFQVSRGRIVIFLDADDILLPTAVSQCAEVFTESCIVAQVHWPLWEINELGQKNGRKFPTGKLAGGNLREVLIENGPGSYINAPTSGNAWARDFLSAVIPIPAEPFRISADGYLFMLAPLFGLTKIINEPQSCYRIHDKNNFKGNILKSEKLSSVLKMFDYSSQVLAHAFSRLNIPVDINSWKNKYWYYKLYHAIEAIKIIIPQDGTVILADDGQWETTGEIAGRKSIPFTERDGKYWGPPPDNASAIKEIEYQRKGGATSIIFAWSAFWYLDYYSDMNNYLKSRYKCSIHTDHIIGFSL